MKKSDVSFPEDMLLPKEQYKEDKMSDMGQQLQSVVFFPPATTEASPCHINQSTQTN